MVRDTRHSIAGVYVVSHLGMTITANGAQPVTARKMSEIVNRPRCRLRLRRRAPAHSPGGGRQPMLATMGAMAMRNGDTSHSGFKFIPCKFTLRHAGWRVVIIRRVARKCGWRRTQRPSAFRGENSLAKVAGGAGALIR